MSLGDIIIAPIYFFIFVVIALWLRPFHSSPETRKFFLPALSVRLFGALSLGAVFQFYYGGGDTFNYYNQGSLIYQAFLHDPIVGLKLAFADGNFDPDFYEYSSEIYWFQSPTEYFVVRLVGLLSIITFNSYAAIALFFAFFSFLGSWRLYQTFVGYFPTLSSGLAIAILFIPSCFFWGSGIMKDSLVLGSLGFLIWSLDRLFRSKIFQIKYALYVLVFGWVIYSVKVYVLICFIPTIFLWWYLKRIRMIKKSIYKFLAIPALLVIILFAGSYMTVELSKTSEKYSLDQIAQRAYITSYDIRYYTGKEAGSGYDIGYQDGTWDNLVKLAPAAINVSLFRPYVWEVRNPLMMLTSLEATVFLILTIYLLLFRFRNVLQMLRHPIVSMSLVFSLVFAFGIGVSTYNFGSLSRYKIPILPLYGSFLVIAANRKTHISLGETVQKSDVR